MAFAANVSKILGNNFNVSRKAALKAGIEASTIGDLKKVAVYSGKRGRYGYKGVGVDGRATSRFMSNDTMEKLHQARGRKIIRRTAAGAGFAGGTAMRPGPQQRQGGYGQVSTAKGLGRYA